MAPPRQQYYGGDGRLSMIAEDADFQPPAKASPSTFSADQSSSISGGFKKLRPGSASHSSKGSGSLPRPSADTAPPGYTLWDVTGPKGEKLLDVRNNKHIAKRGGWKRLIIIGAVLLVIAIGLGVGLGIGLTRRNQQSDSDATGSSPSDQPVDSGPFPQGSFNLPANLANMTTDCTSVSATWQCFPYSTFSTNAGTSGVAFNWVIANASNDPTQLTISSSADPFALVFANASLQMRDQGGLNERYVFSIQLDKYVQPNPPLDTDGSVDGCWFRGTTLSGALYTRKKPDANSGNTTSVQSASRSGWQTWPGAIEVNQTIAGGKGVPTCNKENGDGSQGPLVTTGLKVQDASKSCGCYWRDFDL